MDRYYERIDKIANIDILSSLVCDRYNLGSLIDTKVIEIGYEDFNAVINTSSGKYLMKVFCNSRDEEEVINCINRLDIVGINKISVPKVYRTSNDKTLAIITIDNSKFRLALIEYIKGKDYYNLYENPTFTELDKIVDIAGQLGKIEYKPKFVYDSWAINNFCNEFEKKEKYLNNENKELLKPIYNNFKIFNYDDLPKSFVHGDMRSTNVMKDINGKIWLIDFSVSNYTARLNEITVICSALALVINDKEESEKRINFAFEKWCEKVSATDFEKKAFKLLFSVTCAINIMNSNYEKAIGNTSDETEMHLNAGIFGLTLFNNEYK